jgi:hypothetical protein
MTVTDLEQSVRGALQEADLLQYLDQEGTQFLEFPDGWFVEVVVKDGSKLSDVERVVQKYKEHLRRNDAGDLDGIVRPVWTIAGVERMGPSVTLPGLEPGVRFSVLLRSGSLSCPVAVDITEGALTLIRERLAETKAQEDAAIREIVNEFTNLWLSQGGTSYWDPRRDSRLELDAAAFVYLMGHRDAYDRLKRSIDSALKLDRGLLEQNTTEEILRGPDLRLKSVEAFAERLSDRQVKITDFDRVLPHLPGAGNSELYSALLDFEKDMLKNYYMDSVRRTEEDFPDLKRRFPSVFNQG